ncbi:hypothetical protein FB382_004336 [Nocardioides ginsengisegetis]|uniref:Uncharacterized protein n=1 Tax=Nocardioides ginsengisegetis TaxID=661491 RepID=A0A7W3PBW6_9ACTN|nr:hypothetical protein [Nocardioides ginsengisegetis]MBA8805991.1 hypothetical protein [Nocardioides ginsengisegetis]
MSRASRLNGRVGAADIKDSAGRRLDSFEVINKDNLAPVGSLSAQGWNLWVRPLVTDYPVPTFRPTTAGTPMAVDLVPNGTTANSTKTWIDLCDTDIRDDPYSTNGTNTLYLGIDSAAPFVAAKRVGGSGTKPSLMLKASISAAGSVTDAIRISSASIAAAATADDYTLTADPFIVLGVHGGSVVGGSGFRLKAAADIGFFYIPRINGTPTGTPKTYGKTHPICYDPVAHKMWLYEDGGVGWKSVTFA